MSRVVGNAFVYTYGLAVQFTFAAPKERYKLRDPNEGTARENVLLGGFLTWNSARNIMDVYKNRVESKEMEAPLKYIKLSPLESRSFTSNVKLELKASRTLLVFSAFSTVLNMGRFKNPMPRE